MTSLVRSVASASTNAAASLATRAITSAAASAGPSPSSSATDAAAAATSTSAATNNDKTDGGGSTSKSLLFFVALGFGVVFTNLWIIIGVKYCFRYNRRNRLSRDENGNPIDLATIPRPRRRREKKLMSMDDVNQRFPLTKYKTWRATREQQGLPAEGGVDAPPSRAASIKEGLGLARITSEGTSVEDSMSGASTSAQVTRPQTASTTEAKDFAGLGQAAVGRTSRDLARPATVCVVPRDIEKAEPAAGQPAIEEEDDEDDPIRHSVLPEMLMAAGDTCAICIDTLEDDDEVRGLTCGHAFHAGCLDPWLTSRRACCPLCKADYYVPKARAEADPTDELTARRRPRRNQSGNPTHRHSMFTRPSSLLFDNRRFSMPEWSIFRRQQEELAAAEEGQTTPDLEQLAEMPLPAERPIVESVEQPAVVQQQEVEQPQQAEQAAPQLPQQPIPAAVPRPRRGHSVGEATRRLSSRFANFRLSMLRQDNSPPAVVEQQIEVPEPVAQPQVEAAEQEDEVPAAVPRPRPQQQTETTERNRQSRRLSRFGNLRLPLRRHEETPVAEQQQQQQPEPVQQQQPQQTEPAPRSRRLSWIASIRRPRLPSFLSRQQPADVNPMTPGQLEAGLPAAIRV